MKFSNDTPFSADVFEDYTSDAERYTIVAIRAGYEPAKTDENSETLELAAAKQQDPFLWEDEYAQTANGLMLVKQGDFVPYKPATDITLAGAGCIYAGSSGEANHFAELNVRGKAKKIRLHGERFFRQNQDGDKKWRLSTENNLPPSVPLRWDLAYGGKVQNADAGEDEFNPIGIGNLDFARSSGGKAYPAPQLEYADDPHHISPDRKTPAGFSPIAPSWRWRAQYAGTYDQNWRENIHPFPPRDFNFRFWNCAPPDQQFTPYLQPGEVIALTNLHPSFNFISFAVPAGAFACKATDIFGKDTYAYPVLDGIHIELNRGEYFYVNFCWRAKILTGAGLREITLLHGANKSVVDEKLDGANHD